MRLLQSIHRFHEWSRIQWNCFCLLQFSTSYIKEDSIYKLIILTKQKQNTQPVLFIRVNSKMNECHWHTNLNNNKISRNIISISKHGDMIHAWFLFIDKTVGILLRIFTEMKRDKYIDQYWIWFELKRPWTYGRKISLILFYRFESYNSLVGSFALVVCEESDKVIKNNSFFGPFNKILW